MRFEFPRRNFKAFSVFYLSSWIIYLCTECIPFVFLFPTSNGVLCLKSCFKMNTFLKSERKIVVSTGVQVKAIWVEFPSMRTASCCVPISVVLPDHGGFDTDIFPRLLETRQLKHLCSAPLLAVSLRFVSICRFCRTSQLRFSPDTVTEYKKMKLLKSGGVSWSSVQICHSLSGAFPLSYESLCFLKTALLRRFEDLIECWLVTSIRSLCIFGL